MITLEVLLDIWISLITKREVPFHEEMSNLKEEKCEESEKN